jgi:diaminopimelate decarboxylase
VIPVREPAQGAPLVPMDVVGPICESSDILGRGRMLPELAAGDLVAITGAGAYGAVMASGYNSRPSAAEVMVDGGRFAVVRPSLGVERQFADERIPEWLGRPG